MSVSASQRRKTSNPRRLLPVQPSVATATASNGMLLFQKHLPHHQLPSSRLESIVVNLCRLSADIAPVQSAQSLNTVSAAALEFLASAHKQLLKGLECLRRLEEAPPAHTVHATEVSSGRQQVQPVKELKLTETQVAAAPAAVVGTPEAKRRKPWSTPDKVDPTFVPFVSMDGRSVTLSAKHPLATMSVGAHQHLLWASRGVATLHLRGLLKHFFSREVLAESSVTGVGAYKRPLDKDIVLGLCDYISNRYPGALSDSRMRLCCTDVCVQARRRRRSRGSTGGGSISGSVGVGGGGGGVAGDMSG